jgi:hypothetical protein
MSLGVRVGLDDLESGVGAPAPGDNLKIHELITLSNIVLVPRGVPLALYARHLRDGR